MIFGIPYPELDKAVVHPRGAQSKLLKHLGEFFALDSIEVRRASRTTAPGTLVPSLTGVVPKLALIIIVRINTFLPREHHLSRSTALAFL